MTAELLIDLALLGLVTAAAVATAATRRLLSATMMLSFYSLLMALVWMSMDAVDVAFTEAAVGAGISTILLIGVLAKVGTAEKIPPRLNWPALAVICVTGALLLYGTVDMPQFGAADSPVNRSRVAQAYQRQDVPKAPDGGHAAGTAAPGHPTVEADDYYHGHVPNYVTSVIVDYRSYDTMFETAVILVAGLTLILLLRRPREEERA